tara:strand:- start:613 stop:759 length:147 start_codon:yes stop_codon:yes gene_type:complete
MTSTTKSIGLFFIALALFIYGKKRFEVWYKAHPDKVTSKLRRDFSILK